MRRGTGGKGRRKGSSVVVEGVRHTALDRRMDPVLPEAPLLNRHTQHIGSRGTLQDRMWCPMRTKKTGEAAAERESQPRRFV